MTTSLVYRVFNSRPVIDFLKRGLVKRGLVTILNFHRVSDQRDPLWPPLPIKIFSDLIRFLSMETEVKSIHDAISCKPSSNIPTVCLSFDDGYADFYQNALPIVNFYRVPVQHNICPRLIDDLVLPWPQRVAAIMTSMKSCAIKIDSKTTFFIPSRIGEADFLAFLNILYRLDSEALYSLIRRLDPQQLLMSNLKLMTWDEIMECKKKGVIFGSHGLDHTCYTQYKSEALLREDAVSAHNLLRERIQVSPTIFAFPSGHFDIRAISVLADLEYEYLLLTGDKLVNRDYSPASPKLVHRLNVTGSSYFEAKLRVLNFHGFIKRLLWCEKEYCRP